MSTRNPKRLLAKQLNELVDRKRLDRASLEEKRMFRLPASGASLGGSFASF